MPNNTIFNQKFFEFNERLMQQYANVPNWTVQGKVPVWLAPPKSIYLNTPPDAWVLTPVWHNNAYAKSKPVELLPIGELGTFGESLVPPAPFYPRPLFYHGPI